MKRCCRGLCLLWLFGVVDVYSRYPSLFVFTHLSFLLLLIFSFLPLCPFFSFCFLLLYFFYLFFLSYYLEN